MGCNNKNRRVNADKDRDETRKDDQVNIDQQITQRFYPKDSVFLNFDKTWQKFISRTPELMRPVMQQAQQQWQPLIISDCVYSQDAGHVVPQVEITWTEPEVQERTVRFDIALQSQGFERNYYTTAFPVQAPQRFVIPGISAFVTDTAAILLTGPALLPKVIQFSEQRVTSSPSDTGVQVRSFEPTGGRRGLVKKTLKIQELGFGLSYKFRMASFNREAWAPTQEVIFTTPICPMDRQ